MEETKYTTIIFDLDGTLFYTSDDIAISANLTLDKLGFKQLDKDNIISHVGGGIHNSISRILGDAAHDNPEYSWDATFVDNVVKTYRKIYAEHYLDTTKPYPGVEVTLEKLHENNLNLAVVSNKTIEFTRLIVEHFHMDKYFDVILGGDSLDNKKPHHEPLEHVINHYNSDKNETIIVGDTEKDIAAATNAGIASCGVTYGMRSPEDIKAMKPDFVIDKFDEIRDVLTL